MRRGMRNLRSTAYDFNTAHQFDSALEADDYASKRFFELKEEVQNENT